MCHKLVFFILNKLGREITINNTNKILEVIVKTFQCCYIKVYPHDPLFVSKFQHNRPRRSLGIPYLNMGNFT